ncbi:HMGB family protein [Blastocladiella britannica]|nr:HMGB family protein [Blastocladiella britannica]
MPKEASTKVVEKKTRKPRQPKKYKDPTKPKRPMTAFFLYSGDHRDTIKEANPGMRVGDIAKKLGEQWRGLSEEEKDVYNKRNQQDKKRYEIELATWEQNQQQAPVEEPHHAEDDDEEEEDEE